MYFWVGDSLMVYSVRRCRSLPCYVLPRLRYAHAPPAILWKIPTQLPAGVLLQRAPCGAFWFCQQADFIISLVPSPLTAHLFTVTWYPLPHITYTLHTCLLSAVCTWTVFAASSLSGMESPCSVAVDMDLTTPLPSPFLPQHWHV